jgi:hypothetical protein
MLTQGLGLTKKRNLCCGLFFCDLSQGAFYGSIGSGRISRLLKKFVQQGRRRVETGGVPSGVR